jgi:hypothetical protein
MLCSHSEALDCSCLCAFQSLAVVKYVLSSSSYLVVALVLG